jgi:hypothetical protein
MKTDAIDHLLVDELPISAPVVHSLRAADVTTVGVLRRLSPGELERIHGLSDDGIAEIRDALHSCGRDLADDADAIRLEDVAAPPQAATSSWRIWSPVRLGAACAGLTVLLTLAAEEVLEAL